MKVSKELIKKYADVYYKPLKDFEDKDWNRLDKFFKELKQKGEKEDEE